MSTSSMSGRKNAYKERTFFEKTWPFKVSGKSKTEVLPPDNYEWPFDTILEGSLPESIEGMKDAWIIYRLKAEIGRKRAKDIVVRKPLRIVRTLDPSALELAHAMVRQITWEWMREADMSYRVWRISGQTRSSTLSVCPPRPSFSALLSGLISS